MLFYIGIFIVLGLFLYLDYIYDAKFLKDFTFGAVVLFFILLAGLRWKTGTDWETYFAFFQRSGNLNTLYYEKTMEVGYRYLNYVIRNLFGAYTWFLLICAVIIISIKAYYLKKFTPLFFLGLFLYYSYFFADIFFVRQSLAISITLVSTRYIIRRRFLPFLALILLAFTIHAAAIIFILAYVIYPLRIPNYMFYILIGISFIFMVLGLDILVFNAILKLTGINGILADKLVLYLTRGTNAAFNSGVDKYFVLLLGALKRILIFPIFIWGRGVISDRKKEEYNGLLNLCLIGACLYFLMGNFVALQRSSTYFSFYEILVIIYLVNALRTKIHPIIPYSLVVLYAFSKFYYGFAAYRELLVPYYSIFSKHIERFVY